MQTIIEAFCACYGLPEDCRTALLEAQAALVRSPAAAVFTEAVHRYTGRDRQQWRDCLAAVNALTVEGVHPYTLQLLFSLAQLPAARRRWLAAGYGEETLRDSMADLSYKIGECRRMYGVWGVFVAFWFDRWFDATRFALGRLQFEPVRAGGVEGLENGLDTDGVHLSPDDILINVHIPSSGHMPHESVLDAYRRAAAFFGPDGPGYAVPGYGPVRLTGPGAPVFVCESWLLFPPAMEFLPETCNVVPFARDYTIFRRLTDDGGNLWRTFYVEYTGDPAALPETSSFNRAWKAWLCSGHKPGSGVGVILWDAQQNRPRPSRTADFAALLQ